MKKQFNARRVLILRAIASQCRDSCVLFRTHANGSIKRGSKDNATDAVQLRTGIGVQLKDIKVFNRARQQGRKTDSGTI